MFTKGFFAAAAVISLALTGTASANVNATVAGGAVDDGFLNLRRGPGQLHSVIIGIPRGSRVTVYGCRSADETQSQYGWCNVQWGSYTGWVSANGIMY
jgi:uncharacterized protein YraI